MYIILYPCTCHSHINTPKAIFSFSAQFFFNLCILKKDEDTPAHSKEETTSEEKPSQSSVGHDDPLTVNIKNGDKSDSMSHELSQNGLSVDITVNKHHISDEAKAIAQDSKDLTPSLRISTPPLSESGTTFPKYYILKAHFHSEKFYLPKKMS